MELGNTYIYIRPYITIAEPTDLQKNFSKDEKNQTHQRDSRPRIPPRGKDESAELLALVCSV